MFRDHQTGGSRLTSARPDGTVVHQMLPDYQWLDPMNDVFGYLRIVQLDFASRLTRVRTYSPDLNQYLVDDGNEFTVPLDL